MTEARDQEDGYDEFEIELRSVAGGYEARALTTPCGRAAAPFVLPFDPEKLPGLLAELERRVRAGSHGGRDLTWEGEPPEEPLDLEELGRTLFAALFTGEVARRFRESLVQAQAPTGRPGSRGLRIRLTFDQAEDLALLATLPWELILDDRQYLTLHRLTPIVRSHNRPTSPLPPAEAPLRALLVDSRPTDLPSLDIGGEMDRIRASLAQNPNIELFHLPHPNIGTLRQTLLDKRCQILHFMGHGSFREGSAQESLSLAFEDADHKAVVVTGGLLTEFVKDLPDLRLVVLNACWGAAFPRRRGQDPFTGVAAALISRNIPAVVAMQLPISDRAAIAFSDVFYRRLAAGDSLCAAVTEGRLGIVEKSPSTFEWATPVLFLSGGDRLFAPPTAKPEGTGQVDRAARSIPPPPPPKPLLLAIRSFHDGFTATDETPDDTLDLTPLFAGRLIREHSLWQEEVFPRLREFLLRHAATRRPLRFDFAAHSTLAFAAGYCLEAKSGLDISLFQRSRAGTTIWRAEPGPARQGPLWNVEADRQLSGEAADVADVAMAVGVTWPVLDDVEAYIDREALAIGRILPMTLHPRPEPTGVADGLHALELAQDIAWKIRTRSVRERAAVLHLFAAAPNTLLFFLGQLNKGLGTVQLYEHDPEGGPGAYLPSLRLPLPRPATTSR
ncbi:MAG: SAVED domain-containing protein [Acidobacteriota bacterium]|nr:SAVED domain-containing protein [Acidobacteriota bacterium]